MASILSNKHFHDEKAAYAFVEARVWPEGPVCSHCGSVERISKMGGKSTRIGTYKCYACRKPFTVKVGTVFESSHIPLHIWLQAMHLLSSRKKGVSSNQLHRILGITLKSAWFLSHRIRQAMRAIGLAPLGGEGKTVEFDESHFGGKEKNKHARKRHSMGGGFGKEPVFALVERGGMVRSMHIPTVTGRTLRPILDEQIAADTRTMSDDGGARVYHGRTTHHSVNHSIREYVRGDVHTNTIEGYFSIMKRAASSALINTSRRSI